METSGDLEGNRAESRLSSIPREISVGMLSGAAHVAFFASQEERSLLDPVSHKPTLLIDQILYRCISTESFSYFIG
jgi:hypothetical protein